MARTRVHTVTREGVVRARTAAINELKADPVVTGALGDHVLTHFLDAKQAEWDDYRTHVSDWELKRYLEQY